MHRPAYKDDLGLIGVEKNVESLNTTLLKMSDIHTGDGRGTVGRAGTPFQASDIMVAGCRTNGAKTKVRWQTGEQLGHCVGDGNLATDCRVRLIKDSIFGI